MRTFISIAVGIFLFTVAVSYFFMGANVATAPSRVVNETVKTDNIIGNYEEFFDLKAGYDGRIAQIESLSAQLEAEAPADRRYTQIDLNGAKQTCRQLANRYNADSQKLNRGAFKSAGLPDTLDATACEG